MSEPSAAAQIVLDFANTVDIEAGTDEIATPGGLAAWWKARGLASSASPDKVLALRAGLRARLLLNNSGEPDPAEIEAADGVLRGIPVTVRLGAGPEPAEPLHHPDGLGQIAAAWAVTVASGQWRRLKQCPDHDCGWVFWDATRSRTRRWCTMRICGNRAKTRSYAARRRSAGG